MKLFSKNHLLLIITLLFSVFSYSENFVYDLHIESQLIEYSYPNLDLRGIKNIKLIASQENSPDKQKIIRAEIDFANAERLVATNFIRDGIYHKATVNGAWVYKQVIVEIEAHDALTTNEFISIRLYIAESKSNLNPANNGVGMMLTHGFGQLKEITPKKVADVTSLKIDGKRVTLKLYQKPTITNQEEGFEVLINWLGHGEKLIRSHTPFPADRYYHHKAVAIKTTPLLNGPTGDEVDYQIMYEDGAGVIHAADPVLLNYILDKEFPGVP